MAKTTTRLTKVQDRPLPIERFAVIAHDGKVLSAGVTKSEAQHFADTYNRYVEDTGEECRIVRVAMYLEGDAHE